MNSLQKNNIFKNGIWLTFPPLFFGLSFMSLLPVVLTPDHFNMGVPDVLVNSENIVRLLVFAMPAFFSIGISTKTQERGLILYAAGVILYYLSYGALIIYPDSAWSTGVMGFAATAYTNIFWMAGLGLLGEKFYFPAGLSYRPVFYIAPAIIFVIIHTAHAVIVFQRSFRFPYWPLCLFFETRGCDCPEDT